jgi:outer membrane protein OmpA-like peptidoglycan-associated protein
MHLSGLRANEVRDYLVKVGVVGSRLEAKGLGSSQPVVPNTSEENRQRNRRIEIHFK